MRVVIRNLNDNGICCAIDYKNHLVTKRLFDCVVAAMRECLDRIISIGDSYRTVFGVYALIDDDVNRLALCLICDVTHEYAFLECNQHDYRGISLLKRYKLLN